MSNDRVAKARITFSKPKSRKGKRQRPLLIKNRAERLTGLDTTHSSAPAERSGLSSVVEDEGWTTALSNCGTPTLTQRRREHIAAKPQPTFSVSLSPLSRGERE